MNKADPVIIKAPEKLENLKYNGKRQELVIPGEVDGGTLQYALSDDALTVPEEGWSEQTPTAVAVAPYFVWYRVIGDENHNDLLPMF